MACMTLLGACSGGASDADGARKAALEALVSVRERATNSDFEFYGYQSRSDIGTEQLGLALSIRALDMDALLSNSVLTESLILDQQEYVFPVLVRDVSVSTLQVGKMDDGSWTLIETEAYTNDIDLAVKAIQSHAFDRASCYLLDLPEVELLMLGCRRSGELRLVPLYAPSAAFVIDKEYRFSDIIDAIKAEVLAAADSQVEPDSLVPMAAPSLSAVRPPQAVVKAAQTKPGNSHLPIELVAQQQSQWCWAASAEMTMRYIANKDNSPIQIPAQCAQASKAQDKAKFLAKHVRQDCCANDHANASAKPCNTPWYPEYYPWGFDATWTNSNVAPTWEELKALIDAKQPVAFLWKWKPVIKGLAHYMVAIGYSETSDHQKVVEYLDPWPVGKGAKKTVSYDGWVGGPSARYKHVFGSYATDISVAK